MFERYTESARRALFFSRYQALQQGSLEIDVEHLLLGLLREPEGALGGVLARAGISADDLRQDLGAELRIAERPDASVEIPFAAATKRVLQFAAEEADQLGHRHIGSKHLLLGILREDQSAAAAALNARRLSIKTAREAIAELGTSSGVEPLWNIDGLTTRPYAHSDTRLYAHSETTSAVEDVVGIASMVEQLHQQIPDAPETRALIVQILKALSALESRLGR
jgi:ATP-dependent Clp protease ATP-binding subunit ClpA